MRHYLALPLIATASVCAAQPPAPAGPAAPVRSDADRGFARARVFISPMGEPFRAEDGGENQIARWFDGADTNHDAALSVAEMQADAARFFATLDVNHDGEIDPTEIERYETEVAPETHMLSLGGGGMGGGYRGGGGHRGGGHGGGRGMGMHGGGEHGGGEAGGRRFGGFAAGRAVTVLNLPEPVAAADTNFNRGVTLAEFKDAAGQRFLLLDANHDGKIEPAELVPYRPQRPPTPAANQPHPEND